MWDVYHAGYDFTTGIINLGWQIASYVWPLVMLGVVVTVYNLINVWTTGRDAGEDEL